MILLKKFKKLVLSGIVALSFLSTPLLAQDTKGDVMSDEHKRLIQSSKIGFKKVDGLDGFIFDDEKEHQVIYLFSYSCPFCYAFSSYMQQWGSNLRDSVSYYKIPASFSDGWGATSIAFIISKQLGINGDVFDSNVYRYIHEDRNKISNSDDLVKFFKDKYPEIESSKIEELYSSKAVIDAKKNFDIIIDQIDLEATPSILIISKNGDAHLTSPAIADGEFNAIFTIEYLIYLDKMANKAKEREDKESSL